MKYFGLLLGLFCCLAVRSTANDTELACIIEMKLPAKVKAEKMHKIAWDTLLQDHFHALEIGLVMDSLATTHQLDTQIAKAKYLIGVCYQEMEKYALAVDYYLQALEIYKQWAYRCYEASVYSQLGVIYSKRRNFDETMEYLEMALDIFEEIEDHKNIAIVHNSIAKAYSLAHKHEKALYFYKKVAAYWELFRPTVGLKAVYLNLGTQYAHLGNKEEAAQYFKKSLGIPDSIGYRGHVMALTNLSSILIDLNRMQEAKELFDLITTLPYLKHYHEQRSELAKAQSDWHEKKGQYKQALTFYKHYVSQKDSSFTMRQDTLLSQLKIKQALIVNTEITLEKQKNEQQALAFQQEREVVKQEQQMLFGGLGLSSIVILVLVLLLFAYRKIIRQEKAIQAQQAKEWEQEKQLLATQAMLDGQLQERKRIAQDLHDSMGSLLMGLRAHVQQIQEKTDPSLAPFFQTTDSLFDKTTDAIRRISHDLMPQALEKGGLPSALQKLANKFSQKITCDLEILGDLIKVPENIAINCFYIFQELCQNVLKHAQASHMFLQCMYRNDKLYLMVEDDGAGISENQKNANSGLGIGNIKYRVAAMGGKLSVDSRPNVGSTFQIELPIYQLSRL